MSAATTLRWRSGALEPDEDCDLLPSRILVADSWLVTGGAALAIDLHRERFLASVPAGLEDSAPSFWDAAIAAIPPTGDWFPRVEVRDPRGRLELLARVRVAPRLRTAIVLATHRGPDPRTAPRIKGPDLEAMLRLRTSVQALGADDAVLLSRDGAVAEGSTTCLVWWRDDALAVPPAALPRVDSVTLRCVLAIARGLGVDVREEEASPAALDGLEVWALSALHGIRVVTRWIDGPATTSRPGRATTWRGRLTALRRPLLDPDRTP